MAGQDVRQLLLQVDASVALAQRNLNSLASQVDRDTRAMEQSLTRPEDAIVNLERAFASMDQVLVVSANQRRAYGVVVDQVTAKELQAAQAVTALARAVSGLHTPVQVATRDQLAAAQAIGQFAAQSVRLEGVAHRGGVSLGQYRAGAQQLGFQIGDVSQQIALGINPLTIFAQQSGQVTQAIVMMRGEASAFWAFMGGPWGAVLTGAVSILGMLAFGHRDAGAAANTHESAVQTLIRALNGEADAIRKVNEAIEENLHRSREALQSDTQRTSAVWAEAVAHQAVATAIRQRLLAELEYARHRVEETSGFGNPGDGMGEQQAREQVAARTRVAELDREIATQSRAIQQAGETVVNAQIEMSRRISSAQGRIEVQFDQRIRDLENSFAPRIAAATGAERVRLMSQLAAAEEALNDERETAQQRVQAAEAAERRLNDTRQTGRRITMSEAQDIVRRAGGNPTSGGRSREEQARLYARYRAGTGPLAAPPGSSAHEGPNPHAVDITGLSVGQVREAFRAQGVRLRQVLLETNPRTGARHVHADFGTGGRGTSPETLARRELAERNRTERDDQMFRSALAQANEEYLRARMEMTNSAKERADFEVQQVEAEKAARLAAIESERVQGRLSATEAATLGAAQERLAKQRTANIRAQQADQAAQDRLSIEQASLRGEAEMEQLRSRLAETVAERRDSALRLLDLSQQQERVELEAILASRTATNAQKEIARLRLSRLDTIRGLTVEGINRDAEGQRARYLRELRAGVGDLNTQLENLEVRSMQALDDAARSTLQSVLGLHGAFGDIITDLIMIGVRRAELAGFDALFGPEGSSGKGGGGGGLLGGLLGGLFGGAGTGAMAKGGGKGSGGINNELFNLSNLFSFGGGKAGGGPMMPGSFYLTGEHGPEIIIPKVPSIVIPNHVAFGGREQPVQHNHYYIRGNLMTPEFWQRISAGDHAAAASGAAGGQAGIMRRAARTLP